MSSGTKTPEILVISDQERLHGIFELSGIPCGKTFTLDEGLKSAQRRAPALLFVQSRLGGLSGEIIARHIRLELKDKKSRLVLLCGPEDMPPPGNKTFSAAMDISVPDGELTDQLRSLVDSFLAGKGPVAVRGKGKRPVNSAPDVNGKPVDKEHEGGKVRVTGQERKKSTGNIPRATVDCAPVQPEPADEFSDIVNIAGKDTTPAGPEKIIQSSPESPPDSAARFREELESAMVKTIAGNTAGRVAGPGISVPEADTQLRPAKPAGTVQSAPEKLYSRTRAAQAGLIVSISVVIVGSSLVWLFSGTHPTPKTGETGPRTGAGATASERKIVPDGPPPGKFIGKTDGNATNTGPSAASEQKPGAKPFTETDVKYLKYTIRPGDTVFTILTKRFGLSPRMAESLIPQVLEKNGISRKTVLSVGREILVPGEVKIQPLQGT